MSQFISTLITAVLQVVVFLLIPFIWWIVTARKTQSFFTWLGWKRPVVARPGRLAVIIIGTVAVFTALGVGFVPLIDASAARSPLTGMGTAGIAPVIVYALLQTAFSEESLFRGFILKRVAARFGFWIGNIVQAVAFGLAHMLPMMALGLAPLAAFATGLYSGAIAVIIGWINERMAGGSIVPGWILHGLANLVAGAITLFTLI